MHTGLMLQGVQCIVHIVQSCLISDNIKEYS